MNTVVLPGVIPVTDKYGKVVTNNHGEIAFTIPEIQIRCSQMTAEEIRLGMAE